MRLGPEFQSFIRWVDVVVFSLVSVRALRDGCRESHHTNKRGGEQVWFVYGFHGFDQSAFFHRLL
jgi:hypothetical protein